MFDARGTVVFAFSLMLSVSLLWAQPARAESAETIEVYDFWQFIFLGDTEGLEDHLWHNEDGYHYQGRYSWFYPKRYERDLSLRFWSHIIDPTEEATRQEKLKGWVREAKLYLALVNTPNQAHFQKKIAMANLSFSAMDGGMEDFHFSSIPYLVDSIVAAQKARYHGAADDGFSKRIAKTQDILISSLLNSDLLVRKNLNDMLGYAADDVYQAFQRPVFYEVLGTSLISSYKDEFIDQGVDLLAESVALLDACTTQDCQDALTLAPAYRIMTLLTLAEGYAMQGDVLQRDDTLDRMRAEATAQDWPYLPVIEAYLNDIDGLTSQWSERQQLKLLGVPTGLKAPMTYVFEPVNACRYCHVGQTEVPQAYLPE